MDLRRRERCIVMKKYGALFLALCLILCVLLAGCGKGKTSSAASDEESSDSESSTALVAPTATPVRTAKAARVTADDLRVRSQPSTDGEILGFVNTGDRLPLLVETPSGGWYQVEFEGQPAYISAEFSSVIDVSVEEYNRLRSNSSSASSAASSAAESSAASSSAESSAQSSTESSSSASSAASSSSSVSSSDEDGE